MMAMFVLLLATVLNVAQGTPVNMFLGGVCTGLFIYFFSAWFLGEDDD